MMKLNQKVKKAMRNLSLVALVFSLAFASCNKSNDPAPCESNTVVLILKEASPFFKIIELGVQEAADRRNLIVESHFVESDLDYEGQLKILRSLDLKKYKGVIIAPAISDKMTAELARIAPLLPLVIVDTPVDASVKYHAFIGTDNFNAGKEFGAESKKLFDRGGEPMQYFTIKLKDNPMISSRIDGFMTEAVTLGNFTVIEVTDNAPEGIAKIAEAVKKVPAGTNIGIYAANGSACDLAIEATKTMRSRVSIVNFDMTQKVAEQMYNGGVTQTKAQNTYGLGSEAVKRIFAITKTDNTPTVRDIYMPTMLISYTNMFSPEASTHMQGIDISKFTPTSFDRSLLAGTFVSTSITGRAYPTLDKKHFVFNEDITKMSIGLNLISVSSAMGNSWHSTDYSCILKGDSLIAEGEGRDIRGVLTNVHSKGMIFKYKIRRTEGVERVESTVESTVELRRTTVDYSQAIVGTWKENMDGGEYIMTLAEDGIFNYSYQGKTGVGTYDLCGDHLVAQFLKDGKVVFYRTGVVTIEGRTLTLNGAVYIGFPDAPSDLISCVGVFTRD